MDQGYFYSHKIEDIIGICENIKTEDISNFLDSIDGHFALVLQRKDFSLIAVDKIEVSTFFIKTKKDYFIDKDPKKLIRLYNFDKSIDADAELKYLCQDLL